MDSPQKPPQGPSPSEREGIIYGNALLTDPQALHELLLDRAAVFERYKDSFSGSEEELQGQINAAHKEAVRNIIAPEGLAEASKTIVEGVERESELTLSDIEHQLARTDESLGGVPARTDAIRVGVREARQQLQVMHDLLEGGQQVDIETARRIISKLRDFQEDYGKNTRGLASDYDEAASTARGILSQTEDGEDTAKRGFRTLYRLEEETAPEDLHFEGIEHKVAERGSTTVEQHKEACEAEVTKNDEKLGQIKNGFNAVREDTERALQAIHDNGADSLLLPARVSDTIEWLSRTLYQMEEHGPQMKRMTREALEELTGMLDRIDSGATGIQTSYTNQKNALQKVSAQLAQLRTDLTSNTAQQEVVTQP